MEQEIAPISHNIVLYRQKVKLKISHSLGYLLPNSQTRQQIKRIINQYGGIGSLQINNCSDDQRINRIIQRQCESLTVAYQIDYATQQQILEVDRQIRLILFYCRISKYKHLIEKLIIQAALWSELYSLTWDQLHRLVDNSNYKAILKKYSKFKHARTEPISCYELKTIYQQLKQPLNPDKLQMYLSSVNCQYPLIESSILVIGRTGAGKTTWLQTVLGYHHQLRKDPQSPLYILQTTQPLKQKHKQLIAKKGVVSVTSDIHIIKFGETAQEVQILNEVGIYQEITLVDCPGLNDTRGKQVEIANNYLRNSFLGSCKKIIVIEIVNISMFMADRINNVRNYADYLTKQYKFADEVQLASHLILLYNNCNLKGIKKSNRHFIDQMDSENEVRQLYIILQQEIRKELECDLKMKSAYKFMQKQLQCKHNLIEKVELQSDKRKQSIMLHLISKRVYTETQSFINNFLNVELEDELDDTIRVQREKLVLYLQRKQFLEMHYQYKTLGLLYNLNGKGRIIEGWKGKMKQQIEKYIQEIRVQLARQDTQYYFKFDTPPKITNYHKTYRDISQILHDFDVDPQKCAQLQQKFKLFAQKLVSFVCSNHSRLGMDQIKQEYLVVRQYMKGFNQIKPQDIATSLDQQMKQMTQQFEEGLLDYDLTTDDYTLTNMQQIQLLYESLCLKKYKLDLYTALSPDTARKFDMLENLVGRKIRQIYKDLREDLKYNIKIYSYKRKQFFVVYQLQNALEKPPEPLSVLIFLQKVYKLNELQMIRQVVQQQQISMPEQAILLFKTIRQLIIDCCKYVSTQEVYVTDQTFSHFRQAILAFKRDISRAISNEFTSRYFPQLIEYHRKLQEVMRQKRSVLIEALQKMQNVVSNQKFKVNVMRQCEQKLKYFKNLQLYNKYLQFQLQIKIQPTLSDEISKYFAAQNQLKEQFKSTPIFDPKLFCYIVSPAQHLVTFEAMLKHVLPADCPIFNQIDTERESIMQFINSYTQSLTKGISNLKIKVKLLWSGKEKQEDNYSILLINIQQFIDFDFDDYEMTQLSPKQEEIHKLLRDLFQLIEDKINELEFNDILQRNIPTSRYSEQVKVKFIEKMYSLALKLLTQVTRKDIIPCEQLLIIIQSKMKAFFTKNVQHFKSMDNLSAFKKQDLLSTLQIYSSLVYLIKSKQQSQKSQAQVYHDYQTLRSLIQNLFQKLSLNKFAEQTRMMFQKFSIKNSRFQMKLFDDKAKQSKSDPQKLGIFREYFQQYLGNLLAKLSKASQQFTIDFLGQLQDILPKVKQLLSSQNTLLSTFETQLKKSFTRQKDCLVGECKNYLAHYNIKDAKLKLTILQSWAQIINNFSEQTINQQICDLKIKIHHTEQKISSLIQRVNSDDEVMQEDILNQDEQSLQYCLNLIYTTNGQFKSKLENRLSQILLRIKKRVQLSIDIVQMGQIYRSKYQRAKYLIHYLLGQTKSYKIIFQPLFEEIIDRIFREVEKNVQGFDFSLLSSESFEQLQVWSKIKCCLQLCYDLKKDYSASYDFVYQFRQRSRKYISDLVQQLSQTTKSSLKVQLLLKIMKIREAIKSLISQETHETYSAVTQHFNNLTIQTTKRIKDYFKEQIQNTQLIEQLQLWLVDTKQTQNILEGVRSSVSLECCKILQKYEQQYGDLLQLQNYYKLSQQKQDAFSQLQKDIYFCNKYQKIQSFIAHFKQKRNQQQSKVTSFFLQLSQIYESNFKFQIEDQQVFFHREIFGNEQAIMLDTDKMAAKICFLKQCLQLETESCPIDLRKYVQFPTIFMNYLQLSAQKIIRQFSSSIRVEGQLEKASLINEIINFNPKVYYLYTLYHKISAQKYEGLLQNNKENNQVKIEYVEQASINNSSSQSEALIIQQAEHLTQCAMQSFVGQEDKFKESTQKLIKLKINKIIKPVNQTKTQQNQTIQKLKINKIIKPVNQTKTQQNQTMSKMTEDYREFLQYKVQVSKSPFTRWIKRKYRNPFSTILYYISKSLHLTLTQHQPTNIFTIIQKIQNQIDLNNPKDYRKLLHVQFQYRFILRLMIALYLLKNGNNVYFEVREQKKRAYLQKKLSRIRLDIRQQLKNNLYFGSLDENRSISYFDVDAEQQLLFSEKQIFYTQCILLFDFQSVFQPTANPKSERMHQLQMINKRYRTAISFKTIFMFKTCYQIEVLNKRVQNLGENIFNLQAEISKDESQILRFQQKSSSFLLLIQEMQKISKSSSSALIICFESQTNLQQFLKKEQSRLSKLIQHTVIADSISQAERIDNFKWQVLGTYTRCLLTTREKMVSVDPIKIKKPTSSHYLQLILCYQPFCRVENNLMQSIMKYFTASSQIKCISISMTQNDNIQR